MNTMSSPRLRLASPPKVRRTKVQALMVSHEKELGVIDSIISACKPGLRNRLALWAGLIGGGIVPLGSFLETHLELDLSEGWGLLNHPMAYAVLGGLLFSAITVFTWFKKAYKDNAFKAFGVVVFLESVMTMSHLMELSIAILAILIVVNGFASACILNSKRAS